MRTSKVIGFYCYPNPSTVLSGSAFNQNRERNQTKKEEKKTKYQEEIEKEKEKEKNAFNVAP